MNAKFSTRQTFRHMLCNTPEQQIAEASKSICEHLYTYLEPKKMNSTIAIFSAHGPEINLEGLHHELPKANIVYPLCHSGGILSFHLVDSTTELEPGMLGILEPNPAQHPSTSIKDIDYFLCPGLAFGRDHTRLGHGGGYYDRALREKSTSAQTIGIALNCQIVVSVPHDIHDIQMDHILTESGFLVS